MNKRQKQVQKRFLNNEEEIIAILYSIYEQALNEINHSISKLDSTIESLQKALNSIEDDDIGDLARAFLRGKNLSPDEAKETLQSMIQSKVYQKNYQAALKKQVSDILDKMHKEEFKSVSEYLKKCYEDGFVGTMYDLQGQGIPLMLPIDQGAMVKAVQIDSKISKGLYTRLGEDVTLLKRKIVSEISRGISTGMSFQQIARQLSGSSKIGYNNAVRIARTEGHRIQCQAGMDACHRAKDMGADVLKQWDATLDGRTRESHAFVDGQIRELDKPFGNGLDFPGDPSGGASEVVNCRCALLQRARWALDDEELDILKERADYFGIDKTDEFERFREEYLQAASSSHYLPISERDVPIVRSPVEFDEYIEENDLKPIYRGYSAESDEQLAEYVESHKLGIVPESGEKSSALGKGVYFADSKSEAESYMYQRSGEKSQSKGRVTTAALDVGAKIGTQSELRQKKFEDESEFRSKIFAAQGAGDTSGYEKLLNEYLELEKMSFEDYLKKLGYDAIYDPTTGYTVVLRQKALVIRDD